MRSGDVVVEVAGCALGVDPQAEIAGQVVEAGEAAAEWLGRRVVVPRLLCCGDCDRCRRGHAARCPNRVPRHGLAPRETVPARFLCSLDGPPPLWPADWDPAELWRAAALADAAASPYAALSRAGLGPGEWLCVIGDGARAVLACAIARAKGAKAAVIAGPDPMRRELLRVAGGLLFDASLAPSEVELPAPPEVILETTGSAAGRYRALAMLPPGACAVFLDGPGEPLPVPPVDWTRFCADECRLLGAEAAHPDFLPEVCALFARGELPLTQLVTPVDPGDIEAALSAQRAGKLPQLPIVRFR